MPAYSIAALPLLPAGKARWRKIPLFFRPISIVYSKPFKSIVLTLSLPALNNNTTSSAQSSCHEVFIFRA